MSRRGKHTPKLEKDQRIFTMMGWMIDSVPEYLIKKQAMQSWGISIETARRYYREAHANWRRDRIIDIQAKLDSRIAELQNNLRNMDPKFKNTPQGLKIALAYLKELSKLEGLYPAHRHIHSNDPENPLPETQQVTIFQIPDNNR
ncbi:hypothetical protein IMZ16_03930 [Cruoricaptor ignavus]|uniref:Uncharacterized protein n=1 Tax=Cruoricaptor ignavus TaxID=1118202 RepID=A0A7M1T6U3_9FLAO|nr:hypothetical protein [Cruoricaptor ignavus]QOR74592.1 hypothetical protein IMZ16_03930 [Cruoricaptor ignavus]